VRYPTTGEPVVASGLRLLLRDFAKFGQLVLATTPHINGQQLYFYGYQFWIGRSFVRGREIDWSAAVGLGGQRTFLLPALDLVAVVNAGLYRSPMQAWVPLVVLNRYVLAAAH
jgi:CubicO group peptidase (beta-lactamase class C family)